MYNVSVFSQRTSVKRYRTTMLLTMTRMSNYRCVQSQIHAW